MANDLVSRFTAGAQNEIEDTGRQSRFVEDLREYHGSCGRQCRGLKNNGVARHESRSDLPSRDRDRKIPWGDRRNHTVGFLDGVSKICRQFRRDRFTDHPT